MKKYSQTLPLMFADHHVTEVRRLLSELPGVVDIYASSSFQVVEVEYDEAKLNADEITSRLGEAGYVGELPAVVERGATTDRQNGGRENSNLLFRHSTASELSVKDDGKRSRPSLSFAQKVPYSGRPLWPCPGLGPLERAAQVLQEETE